jgi:hypothetical protein
MKQFIFKLAAIILALILVLVGLEVVVRVFNLSQPRIGQADPIRGFANIPGAREVNQHGVKIDIGDHGFRGPTPSPEKAPGAYRVILLGDSFVFAASIDYENTFAGLLNRRFQEKKQPIEVIDMGVDGYGTTEELLVYEHEARKLKPDLVVLCFYVGNDLQNNYPPREHFPGYELENDELIPVPFEVRSFRRNALRDFLRHNVRIYSYLPDLWRGFVTNLELKLSKKTKETRLEENQAQYEWHPPKDYGRENLVGEGLSKSWQVSIKLIEKLNREVAADGGQLAIVVFPIITQVYDHYWDVLKSMHKPEDTAGWDRYKPQKILEKIARENNIVYIPIVEQMAEEAKETGVAFYIPKNPHFNAQAYAFIASLMEPYIQDLAEKSRTGAARPTP